MEKSDSNENKIHGFRLDFNDVTEILTVHELVIKNREVIEYLRNSAEVKQEEVINDILEFGVKSLKSFLTENYGSLIDLHFKGGFSDLDSKLSDRISQINKEVLQVFINDANEKIVRGFSKEFDDKKESLIKLLNENKDRLSKEILQSFLNELKDDIFTTFKKDFTDISADLKQSLLKYVTEEEGKEKTTLKGKDFEEYVFRLSESHGRPFGDEIEHVGIDNHAGDVLVRNLSDGLMFCIEAKDTSLTNPKIMEAFDDIERVRKVQHSMIVFHDAEQLPKGVGSLYLFGWNRLVIAISENAEGTLSPFLFGVGYRIMRYLVLTEKPTGKLVDKKEVMKHVNNIVTSIRTIGSIKGKVTSFSKGMIDDLDDLKGKIDTELEKVEEALRNE